MKKMRSLGGIKESDACSKCTQNCKFRDEKAENTNIDIIDILKVFDSLAEISQF